MTTSTSQQEPELVQIGSFSLVDPGGNPAVLRSAAGEWEARAGHLRAVGDRLGDRVRGLPQASWDGEARQAFQSWWAACQGEVDGLASGFDEMAAQLRELAGAIEETNRVVHSIYMEIGATIAIGVAVSFVSFGLGTAAAAARTATLVQRAISWVNRLRTLMQVARATSRALAGFKATYLGAKLVRYGGMYTRAVGINAAAGSAQRMAFERSANPFANWSDDDLRNLLVGSATGVGLRGITNRGRVEVWSRLHPRLSAAAYGFAGGTGNSLLFDALDGDLGRDSVPAALVSGAFTAGSATLVSRLTAGRPGVRRPVQPGMPQGWTAGPGGLVVPGPGAPPTVRVTVAGPGGTPATVTLPVPRPGLDAVSLATPSAPPGYVRTPGGMLVPNVAAPAPVSIALPAQTPGFVDPSTPPRPMSPTTRVAFEIGLRGSLAEIRSTATGVNPPARPQWDLPAVSVAFPPPPPVPVAVP